MELRKRKAAPTPPAPAPASKKRTPAAAPSKPSTGSTSKKPAHPPPTASAIEEAAKGAGSTSTTAQQAPPATATLVEEEPGAPEDVAPPGEATAETTTTTADPVADVSADADADVEASKPPVAHAKASGGGGGGRAGPPKQGDTIELEGFGGKVKLDDGSETTFKELVEKSGKGVVVFTYPKASTPGCTKQACLFRDLSNPLISPTTPTTTTYTIYGLSRDNPAPNANFRSKYSLPYSLICDADGSLLKALGFAKPPKSAVRGVVVVGKEGKVLGRVEGGPDATVEAAGRFVGGL